MELFRKYYLLTKPGIIRGNLLTAIAGFLLASVGHIKFKTFIATMVGISLVIGSSCVINNYIDRGIDKKMARTKKRALVTGAISGRNAIIFAITLGIVGFVCLAVFTNITTVVLGLIGVFFYVVVYGIAKRKSIYGTIVGSISGAIPPAAAYTAASGHFDAGAYILFLILVFWQMPHFYAIAMYRYDDYANASIPVLPVKKGMLVTKINIMIYILGFIIATVILHTRGGYLGKPYVIVSIIIGLLWLGFGIKGFNSQDDKRWGKKMFLASLAVISILCLTISVDSFFH